MPTSSLFTTVVIDTDEKADKFIKALEEASKHPIWIPSSTEDHSLTDIDEIRKLFAQRKK